MPYRKFSLAIACSDGRCQSPLKNWCIDQFGAEFVDRVALPGIVGLIAGRIQPELGVIERAVRKLAPAHKIDCTAVLAHAGCAGNPVSDDEQRAQLCEAAQIVYDWGVLPIVRGIFIHPVGVNGDRIWTTSLIASVGDPTGSVANPAHLWSGGVLAT